MSRPPESLSSASRLPFPWALCPHGRAHSGLPAPLRACGLNHSAAHSSIMIWETMVCPGKRLWPGEMGILHLPPLGGAPYSRVLRGFGQSLQRHWLTPPREGQDAHLGLPAPRGQVQAPSIRHLLTSPSLLPIPGSGHLPSSGALKSSPLPPGVFEPRPGR